MGNYETTKQHNNIEIRVDIGTAQKFISQNCLTVAHQTEHKGAELVENFRAMSFSII